MKLLLQFSVSLTLIALRPVATHPQTVLTFDDLTAPLEGRAIPNGYGGLNWSNFWVANSVLMSNFYGYSIGYNYGMVSPSNVAYDAGGTPAEIDSATNFNFLSAYLTGAWNSNLNIEVEGFNGAEEIYNTIVVASATNPTLFTFNYLDIDRLYFNSYGGQVAFGPSPGYNFVMDNMGYEFVPEPSSFLLAALGAMSLVAFLRRKRG
jgi:hypothetical protein